MIKRIIAILLIITVLSSVCFAGRASWSDKFSEGFLNGTEEGRMYKSPWTTSLGGFCWGYGLGIIGVGITQLTSFRGVNSPRVKGTTDYRLGYDYGYQREAKGTNRLNSLLWSITGLVVWLGTGTN
ncbi:hypothetical protein OAR19_00095 [bacterium]|nr:hypothetical protein [bacterium]